MDRPARKPLPRIVQWTPPGRALIFCLAATSIWSLLAEFYNLWSMRTFTFGVLVPATAALVLIALLDRSSGDGRLWKSVVIGATGGLLAAVAYDVFRLPWVVCAATHAGPGWLRLPLFKVFPRFGAMILNQPLSPQQPDSQFPLSAHVVGWAYHLSNGITFGIMYMAMIGNATKRTWLWGIALAAGLELAMLFTPYPRFFGIPLTVLFVVVTLIAHTIFGAVLGLYARVRSFTWRDVEGRAVGVPQ